MAAELNSSTISRLELHIRLVVTANLHGRNRFAKSFWCSSQPVLGVKCFVPASYSEYVIDYRGKNGQKDNVFRLPFWQQLETFVVSGGVLVRNTGWSRECVFFSGIGTYRPWAWALALALNVTLNANRRSFPHWFFVPVLFSLPTPSTFHHLFSCKITWEHPRWPLVKRQGAFLVSFTDLEKGR